MVVGGLYLEGSKQISPAQISGTRCGGLERRPGKGVYVEEAWGGKERPWRIGKEEEEHGVTPAPGVR